MKTIGASELRRAPYILLAIFVLLAAGIITAGYLYHQHYKENYRLEVERRLCAIAELKVNELVRWRNERLSDAGIFHKNDAFAALVRRFFETPDDMEAQGQIRTWLSQVQAAYKYDRVMLLDAQGVERISVPDTLESVAGHPAGDTTEVLRLGEVTFLDFHRHAPDYPICLGVLVPIVDGQDENRAIGILTLDINAETYLYPFINLWPTPSRTAETLIVRREGNEVVFLNELKFQKNTALNLRVPLANNELPAVKAALDQEGIVEGIDYGGMPVIADVHAVPDSPWFLVARMGTSEMYAPLQKELWVTIILVGILLMAAGAGVGFIWKQQSAHFYRKQYEAAGALRESEAKYRTLIEHLPQKVFLKDRNSVYVSCNENYAWDLGITSEQLPGKSDYDFFPAALAEKYKADDGRIMESGETSDLDEPYLSGGRELTVHTVKTPVRDKEGKITGVLGIFWDVTESKRAEEAIKESEEKFRAIFDHANDGILLADEKTRRFYTGNNTICQILGYSLEEIKNLGVTDIHPEEDLPYVIEQFERQLRREIAVAKDLPVKRKDGTVFFADINTSLVTLAGRTYLLGLFRDVTERKQAEETLRGSEEKFKNLIETTSDWVWECDEEGRYTYVSPKVKDLLGYEASEILGKTAFDLMAEDEGAKIGKIFKEKSAKKEAISGLENTNRHKDGHLVVMETSAVPILDVEGRLKGYRGIDRDITERKKAEETQFHLLTMLETTPDFVGFADPKNAGILYINSAGRQMVGVGADEDVTMLKINDVHPEWTNQLFRDEIIPTAIRDGVWKGECAFLNRGGHEIPVMMVLMAHKSASGEVVRLSTISRDITERKQMEANLRSAKAQADTANEAKSEFLANMSHEIRTPLNAIIGFSEILACEDLSDEQAEWIKTIRDSGEHLLELINDILDFSRIEAGKLDLEMIEYSLENLCAKVESLMRPAAMKKGLKFGFRENGVLPTRIRTDPMRLSQCLLNLVNNAIRFTEQGHVYVNISLEEVDDEPCIRFDVEDTGMGIPLEKQQVIFESFTQADSSTTRRFGGNGLGLAITKSLAELLGGRVSLASEEGKGSVFSLVVPVGVGLTEQAPSDGRELADESSTEQSPPRRTAPDPRSRGDAEFKFTGRAPRGRALVAEDAVTNQMLIKVMLEKMGLEVTMVKDGAEAVREGLAQSFDLIFMDIQMPNMNGYEAARRLRKKGLTTPIIALTANAMEGDDKKCIEAGCDDYLPKPIERAKLMEITRKYLTPQPQDLSEKIDSVKSTVDDLGRLCSKDAAPQADSADAASAGDVIDWDQLISRVIEEGIAREIVPLCVVDNRERLEMLDKAVRTGNAEEVKLYAHAIKGSAGNIGAGQLSDVAAQLEHKAFRGDLSQAEQLLQGIKTEFARLESFISNPDWVEIVKRQSVGKQPQ